MLPNQTADLEKTMYVLVATPLGQGGKGGIDRIMDDVRNELAAKQSLAVTFVTTRGQGHIALSPLYLGGAIIKLMLGRFRNKLDVLHVNLSSHGSTRRKLALCMAARLFGVPYVLHLHGSRFRQFWEATNPAQSARIDTMFNGAARILVLGKVWQAFVAKRVPTARERIVCFPNASRAPSLPAQPTDGVITILFLGQVGPRKGIPQLLDALDAIADVPGWRAIVAGNGAVEEARARVTALNLSERVRLTGWIGPEEVNRLLATSNILVLPSFDENLPMSVIEGMSYGLSVVTTPVGAVEDIITDGTTGLLVPPGDAGRLADALRRLISDPALRANLGQRARQYHRENLEIGPYVAHLCGIWTEVARRR